MNSTQATSRNSTAPSRDRKGLAGVLASFGSETDPADTLYDLDAAELADLDLGREARVWLKAAMLSGRAPNRFQDKAPWRPVAVLVAVSLTLLAGAILAGNPWLLLAAVPVSSIGFAIGIFLGIPMLLMRKSRRSPVAAAVRAAVVPGDPEPETLDLWALADQAYDTWRRDKQTFGDRRLNDIRTQVRQGLRLVIAARRATDPEQAAQSLRSAQRWVLTGRIVLAEGLAAMAANKA